MKKDNNTITENKKKTVMFTMWKKWQGKNMFPQNIGEMFQRRVTQFAGTWKKELKQRIWGNTPYSFAFLNNLGAIAYGKLNSSLSVIYQVNALHRLV